MHESGYTTLAFFSLRKFDQLNCPETYQKPLTLYPGIFDNRYMPW